jgi:hypothetical protein
MDFYLSYVPFTPEKQSRKLKPCDVKPPESKRRKSGTGGGLHSCHLLFASPLCIGCKRLERKRMCCIRQVTRTWFTYILCLTGSSAPASKFGKSKGRLMQKSRMDYANRWVQTLNRVMIWTSTYCGVHFMYGRFCLRGKESSCYSPPSEVLFCIFLDYRSVFCCELSGKVSSLCNFMCCCVPQ